MANITDDSLLSLKEMKKALTDGVEQLKEEISMSVTVADGHGLTDSSLDALDKTKMLLESEIEALLQEELLQLPDDQNTLLGVALEETLYMSLSNERTVDFYKDKVLNLEEEKKFYESVIKKATAVDEDLSQLIATQTRNSTLLQLRKKLEDSAVAFRTLRGELQYILSNLYPEPDEGPSLENLLEPLVSKLFSDPQDPYVTVTPETPATHVAFLLRANFIRRHPKDATKFRYIDTRF
ncbi:centromere protein K-like [Macrobrachium rosenbergii]|uniref:centromere protein K-like n=1 Tax=Macrobrachium rosenbergii TaxID=79674 RepID=UPI0034D6D22B